MVHSQVSTTITPYFCGQYYELLSTPLSQKPLTQCYPWAPCRVAMTSISRDFPMRCSASCREQC